MPIAAPARSRRWSGAGSRAGGAVAWSRPTPAPDRLPGTTRPSRAPRSSLARPATSPAQGRYRQPGHAGDVLAVIAAPELDHQLAQARAQLAQMQAALAGASKGQPGGGDRGPDRRWWSKAGRAAARRHRPAELPAQTAAVGWRVPISRRSRRRWTGWRSSTGYERIVAPFDGVITSRQIDIGSLVTADAPAERRCFDRPYRCAAGAGLRAAGWLFGLKDGEPAEVTVPELPGRVFHGRVARNARALQPRRGPCWPKSMSTIPMARSRGLYCGVQLEVPRRSRWSSCPPRR